MINIVLYEPEIPQNTGNIARTCAVTGARLHLIRPLGFDTDEKSLRRAGLDYWHLLDISYYDDFGDFLLKNPNANIYLLTTKGSIRHSDVHFKDGDFLVFGPESRGLPENLIEKMYSKAIRIPMRKTLRSLNLSNSVAICLYEALRQLEYDGLESCGELTGREEQDNEWLKYI